MDLVRHVHSVLCFLLPQLLQCRNLLELHVIVFLREMPLCRHIDCVPLLRIDRSGVTEHAAFDAWGLLRDDADGDRSAAAVTQHAELGVLRPQLIYGLPVRSTSRASKLTALAFGYANQSRTGTKERRLLRIAQENCNVRLSLGRPVSGVECGARSVMGRKGSMAGGFATDQ